MPHRATRLSSGARVYIAVDRHGGNARRRGIGLRPDRLRRRVHQWLVLAGLAFLTGSFSIKLPSINARISVSEAFVFAAVLLFGPSAATIIVTLDAIILSSWASSRRHSKVRAAFNICAAATAIWVAAHLFRAAPAADTFLTETRRDHLPGRSSVRFLLRNQQLLHCHCCQLREIEFPD